VVASHAADGEGGGVVCLAEVEAGALCGGGG